MKREFNFYFISEIVVDEKRRVKTKLLEWVHHFDVIPKHESIYTLHIHMCQFYERKKMMILHVFLDNFHRCCSLCLLWWFCLNMMSSSSSSSLNLNLDLKSISIREWCCNDVHCLDLVSMISLFLFLFLETLRFLLVMESMFVSNECCVQVLLIISESLSIFKTQAKKIRKKQKESEWKRKIKQQ